MGTPLAADVARHLKRLKTPNAASLRSVRRDVSKQVAAAPGRVVIDLAVRLVEQGPPGAYPVAYELIRYHPSALSLVRARDLQRLGKHMRGWGDVDSFAGVAGPAWRERQVADAVIHRWACSRNRWWRRAALVSTVPLNVKAHGGKGDARRTLAVCRLLLEDQDDMVGRWRSSCGSTRMCWRGAWFARLATSYGPAARTVGDVEQREQHR
jgi:hypothetical protein